MSNILSSERKRSPFLRILLLIACCFSVAGLSAQEARLSGVILDAESGLPVESATLYIRDKALATETDSLGRFELKVPAGVRLPVVVTRIGYISYEQTVSPLKKGESRRFDVKLSAQASDMEVVVSDHRVREPDVIRQKVEALKYMPSVSGNLESLLPYIGLGTSSGSGGELSSQYNVRGGNYDENLVYVNGFEIYRPQLIRTSQQEGLSFPNIDLVENVTFSSGGFQAKYGDKLSSVLDIQYKRPDSLRSSIALSMLGGSAHVEGSIPTAGKQGKPFRFLAGARYKTTRYLLGSLDIQGEYVPDFMDFQANLTYEPDPRWQVGLLGNFNRSVYRFRPETRSTALGLVTFALRLSSAFEGQERNDFTHYLGGLHLTWLSPNRERPLYMKWLFSTFQSFENERIDVTGAYRLSQIETSLGSDNAGEEVSLLGEGSQQQYIRNFLLMTVANAEWKGGLDIQTNRLKGNNHFLQWGLKVQREWIDDEINEWERLDSAGYSLPYQDDRLSLNYVYKSRNDLSSNRFSAFFQDAMRFHEPGKYDIQLTAGVRAGYWDLNREFYATPRAQFSYRPLGGEARQSFSLAAGMYVQPPLYREMRNDSGEVNTDLLSQKSVHLVAGYSLDFEGGKKRKIPYKLITEIYYKQLWDLVSYEIDNVRIRYSGSNNARGYAMGLDLRVNGEFVKGAESWISLSLLRVREKLDSIQHLTREIGQEAGSPVKDVPRPSDQLVNLNLFFQDYLPRNENFRMHLNLVVGTGLPYGIKGNNIVYRNPYRFKAYHRVDIGFSTMLYDRSRAGNRPHHPLRFAQSAWLSLEVFNLLQVSNVASNTWIKTVFSQQYAIPNYLTSRRINLRLRMQF